MVGQIRLAKPHQHTGFQVRGVEDEARAVGEILQGGVPEQVLTVGFRELLGDRRQRQQRPDDHRADVYSGARHAADRVDSTTWWPGRLR